MLPIMTKPEDALAVATYLSTKITGASLQDVNATLEGRLLDGRKIAAFVAWGLITREADMLRLTPLGRQLARASADDQHAKHTVFTEVVQSIRAYRIAAEWIHYGAMEVVPLTELATHWFDKFPDDLGTTSEKTIRYQANCFFGVAEAAGLGRYVMGRRGQPTRFEVDQDPLSQMVAQTGLSSGPSTPSGSTEDTEEPTDNLENEERRAALETVGQPQSLDPGRERYDKASTSISAKAIRVFISHGPNVEIVDQVKTMLDLSGLHYDVVVEQESTAIPVPQKVLDAMRRCDAAVMCVTADTEGEREDGSYEINPNVLIEIGAAFVLYEKRVALVWDRRISVPSNLQGLYRCEFKGNELSWSAGMKLMKAVNEFKGMK